MRDFNFLFPEIRRLSDVVEDMQHFGTSVGPRGNTRIDVPLPMLRKGYYFLSGLKGSIHYPGGIRENKNCYYLYGRLKGNFVEPIGCRMSEGRIGCLRVISEGWYREGIAMLTAVSADLLSTANLGFIKFEAGFREY